MGNGFAGTGICFERRSRTCGKGNCILSPCITQMTFCGRLFQMYGTAAAKARPPSVERVDYRLK